MQKLTGAANAERRAERRRAFQRILPAAASAAPTVVGSHHSVVGGSEYPTFRVDPAKLSPEMLAYYNKNAEEHKIMRSLHEKLKLATTDAERAILRDKIERIDNNVSARWAAIDLYLQSPLTFAPAAGGDGDGADEGDDEDDEDDEDEDDEDDDDKKNDVLEDVNLSHQLVVNTRSMITRCLKTLEEAKNLSEAKRVKRIKVLKKSAEILLRGKVAITEDTLARIRVYLPEFGVEKSNE
jgi:hypothetical protein